MCIFVLFIVCKLFKSIILVHAHWIFANNMNELMIRYCVLSLLNKIKIAIGWAIDPAPGGWFLTNFISFVQVVPGPVQPYSAELWPKTPFMSLKNIVIKTLTISTLPSHFQALTPSPAVGSFFCMSRSGGACMVFRGWWRLPVIDCKC